MLSEHDVFVVGFVRVSNIRVSNKTIDVSRILPDINVNKRVLQKEYLNTIF